MTAAVRSPRRTICRSRAACGGVVQCDGSGSIATPENLGQLCGQACPDYCVYLYIRSDGSSYLTNSLSRGTVGFSAPLSALLNMSRSLPFIYAVEELSDALTERLNPIFARAELTAAQFSVLYALIEEGPLKLSALAERQRCVKSNVSYLTRIMQTEGLITLSASEEDQRARVMQATKLGRERYATAKAESQKLESALRRKLGVAATEQLMQACLEAAATLDSL